MAKMWRVMREAKVAWKETLMTVLEWIRSNSKTSQNFCFLVIPVEIALPTINMLQPVCSTGFVVQISLLSTLLRC